MTSSDYLFRLIKTLKKSEKRYFKIYASLHNKEEQNIYIRLFDEIEKQKDYDEAALLKTFEKEYFTRHFSVIKNYLFKQILKSLRSYYSGQDVESKLNNRIESVKILYGKGLYQQCLKILNKTKQIAKKYEKHEHLLNILKWEREVILRYLKGTKLKEHQEIMQKENEEVLRILKNKYDLGLLEQKAYDLYVNYMIARSEEELKQYQSILSHPVLQKPSNALSTDAKWSYNNIHGVFHTAQENFDLAAVYDEKQLKLLEDNPDFLNDNINLYIKALNNLLDSYVEAGKYERVNTILQKLRSIPNKYGKQLNPTQEAFIFETSYNLELMYCFNTRQFAKGLRLVPQVEAGLKKHRFIMNKDFEKNIIYTVSKLYFYSGKITEAQLWVNRIIGDDDQESADDLSCFARILNLLIHYEQQNYEHLKYEIKSSKRYLIKKKRFYKVEELTLKHLNRLVNCDSEKKVNAQLILFRDKLEFLIKQPFEKHAQSYLNLLHWINSKIKKVPLQYIFNQEVNP